MLLGGTCCCREGEEVIGLGSLLRSGEGRREWRGACLFTLGDDTVVVVVVASVVVACVVAGVVAGVAAGVAAVVGSIEGVVVEAGVVVNGGLGANGGLGDMETILLWRKRMSQSRL